MGAATYLAAQASGSVSRQTYPSRLEQAILETFIYADIFNYPLAVDEVVRYVTIPAGAEEVRRALEEATARGQLERANGYFALAGRGELIALRERRARLAEAKWARARRYTRLLATLPFVRMVAITGTLAVNNAEARDDIDFFVVTEPERLWLCRALVIGIVRMARLDGDELCPNYFVSERQLVFDERNYFSAREVAQMVPLYGLETYRRVRARNAWVDGFLPQADGIPVPEHSSARQGQAEVEPGALLAVVKRAGERLLRGRLGAALDRREMERKTRQLRREAERRGGNVDFSADVCKGHFDQHDNWIMLRFRDRLAAHGLTVPMGVHRNGVDPAGDGDG
jgi:hypothetical protein